MTLPTEARLKYWKLLAETVLILFAIVLLAAGVFRSPSHAVDKAIGKAIK